MMSHVKHIVVVIGFILCGFLCARIFTNTVYAENAQVGDTSGQATTDGQSSDVPLPSGIYFNDASGYFSLYENGVMNKTKGWHKLSDGNQVYVTSDGYITAKLTKSGDIRRYYNYDKAGKAFVAAKNCWKKLGSVSYYFNKSGVSTRMYKQSNSKLYLCKNKKMAAASSGIYLMSNGKYYFFNSKGIRVTKSGWRKLNKTTKVYISNKGYVTYKYVKTSKSAKCYKYNASAKKWTAFKNSWLKISGKYYYFGSNGIMQKNTIVGSKSKGYYYVDKTGVRVTSKEIRLAVKYVTEHTKSSWSNERKMKACYDYFWKNYPYKRYYESPTAADMSAYAYDMLKNGYGNCYRYAAAYACIATVLGYDARVSCGRIPHTGGGTTPHGWTEVYADGKWLLCDPDMQMNFPNIDSYMKTDSEYAYPHTVSDRFRITVKNGKVTWK